MKTHRPSIELLEARIAPASFRWNIAGSGLWNNAANWFNETTGTANNGFPNAVDDVAKFTSAATGAATVTISSASVVVGSLIFDDNNPYTIAAVGGSLTLTGTAGATISLPATNTSSHIITASIFLNSALTIDTASTPTLNLNGSVIDGGVPRALTKNGTGNVSMAPSAANSLLGTTTVNAGAFLLQNANAQLAGPVVVGGAGSSAALGVAAGVSNVLGDTQPLTINALGTYFPNGSDTLGALTINDGTVNFQTTANLALTVGSLAMTGGSVVMGASTQQVILGGDVTATSSAASSALIVGGGVSLGSAARTFAVAAGPNSPALVIGSVISAAAAGIGLTKTGTGTLFLEGGTSNIYTGTTTVNDGLLALSKTSGGVAIAGPLVIGDGTGGAEADGVRLFGISQINNSSTVTVNASGLLDLNGFSDVIGATTINGGHATTGLAAASVLSAANITLNNGGRISAEVAGSEVRVNNLTAGVTGDSGSVIDGRGSLGLFSGSNFSFNVLETAAATDLTIAIPITGAAATLAKNGAGTLALDTTNTYGGLTTVSAGTLSVGGSIGDVTVTASATLTGSGATGAVTLAGILRPDSLASGSLIGGATGVMVYIIDGTTPGDGPGFYDQLSVTGTVNLTGLALVVTGGADLPARTPIVLIENDGADAVVGTFDGKPEGSVFEGNNRDYLLSYAGGDGNDVVLMPRQHFIFDGGTAPDGDDIFVVRRDATDTKLLHITVQTGILDTVIDVSLNQFAGVLFRGGLGNDFVVFDGEFGYFTSSVQFTDEIIFDGGPGQNSLRLNSGAGLPTASTATFTPAGSDGGSLQLSNNFGVSFTGVGDFFNALPADDFELVGRVGAADDIALTPGSFAEEAVLTVAGRVPVTLRNQAEITLAGGGGEDTFRIGAVAAAAGIDTIEIPLFGSALATLTVVGGSGDDLFTFNAATNTITRTGQPAITSSAALATVFEGRGGNDELQITNGSALGTTFIGGAGSDTLSFALSLSAVGFNADLLGTAQTLNGLGWSLTLGDVVENFIGSTASDTITLAPGATPRAVTDPNGTGTLILDGLGSALTVNGPLLNNATGSVTLAGLSDPTFFYENIGLVRLIRVPGNETPDFGTPGNTFAAPLDFTVGKGAVSIATGDFNNDGRADFVTANSKAGTISIALSAPLGLFLPTVQKATGGAKPTSVVIGNFDGVNGVDIAVTNAGSGNVAVFLNDGAGGFGDAVLFSAGKKPGTLRAGDLDTDGDVDLPVILGKNQVAILLGNGDGTFAAPTTIASGAKKPRDLALDDLDDDNDLDLAVLHTGGELATHLNDGAAAFATPLLTATGAGATALAVADFNGDGKLDAAVSHNAVSRFVAVLLGNGTGAFPALLKIAFPLAAKTSAIVASDFDGDGLADLALANGVGGRVNILRSLGTGAFARSLDLSLEDAPPRRLVALALGDFDGDGRDDLAALSGGTSEVSVLTRA